MSPPNRCAVHAVAVMREQDGNVAEGSCLAVAFHVCPPAARRQADRVLVRWVVIELELLQALGHFDTFLPLEVIGSGSQTAINDVRERKQVQQDLSVAVYAVLRNYVAWERSVRGGIGYRNQPSALV